MQKSYFKMLPLMLYGTWLFGAIINLKSNTRSKIMNAMTDILKNRRSIRKFKPEMPERPDIE